MLLNTPALFARMITFLPPICPKGYRVVKKSSLRSINKEDFIAALEKTDWNKAKAARILDISRSTLYAKLQELNISH